MGIENHKGTKNNNIEYEIYMGFNGQLVYTWQRLNLRCDFLSDSRMCCEVVTVLSKGPSGKYNPALMGPYQNVVYNKMIVGNHVWFMDVSKNNGLHSSIYKGIDDHWIVRLIC